MKYSKEEIDQAKARLKEWLPEAKMTITQVVTKVSPSGMSRHIKNVLVIEDSTLSIDWHISRILDLPLKNDGVMIGGCGMDMGFAIAYDVGRTLYPDGFECLGKDCPSNDHANGDKNYEPHNHSDGGYLVKQRWL